MKKLIPVAALLAAMSVPALAQEATTPTNPAAQPALPSAAGESTVAKSLSGDISASKLINGSVKNAANESIGDINDVLISSDGKVAAVIVGVGGFLGMGEKDVALPFDQLMFAKGAEGDLSVSTSMTKESLQAAPEYVKPEKRL